MLTDSGGFQVMSLSELRKVSEHAVTFRSHIDGAKVELSPERSIEVQRLLGSDIAMQMDECVRLPAERADIERAMQLSLRWAERSKRAFESAPPGYMLFGIVQGGDVPATAPRQRAQAWSRSAFTAMRSAGSRWAKARAKAKRRSDRAHRRALAHGSPALSHGRRDAGRSCWRRWRAASTCSTA